MRGKKILKNISSTLILQIVSILCNFIIPVTLIRTYGSNVNGLVNSITQFLAYITLLESGIGPVIKATLYKPIAKKNHMEIQNILKSAEKFFRIIAYIYIFYIIILCIVFPIIMKGQFDFLFTLSLVLIISISSFVEYYFGIVYELYLQANQMTYVTSNIRIVTTIANIMAILLLIHFGASIQIVKLTTVIIFAFRPIIQNIYVKKKFNINLKKASSDYKLKRKWDGLAQHIAYVIHSNTDIAVLTLFADIKEVSVYSIYMLVLSAIKNLLKSFTSGIDSFLGNILVDDDNKSLNKYFSLYEFAYFTILTIIFSCTFTLILSFIKVYTMGITDVSYYRPTFAYLIVLSEFIYMIRMPYINITYAAGHFKETRKGAWVEAFSNIVISVILVIKYGIVGVAIGTLIAMIIRTIEFMYHSNKYILKRSIFESIKKVLLLFGETLIIIILINILQFIGVNSYLEWILKAIVVFIISSAITIIINLIFYKDSFKELFNMLKKTFINKKC